MQAVLQTVIMGIRGLMSFVEDHSNEFFTDLKLRDTKIVIDGYALFHRLCFNSNLELRFQWRNVNTIKGTQDCYIPAKCFSLDALCHHFSNMNKALLPLFAVLCGNDHINLPIIETFLSKVRLPLGATSSKGRRHHRVLGLLNWLSHFADPTEALDNVLKYLPKKDRENVKEILCSSMEEYQQSQVKLQDFFQYGTYACPAALNLDLPEWVLVALAKGQLSPFISDALVLRRTILHTQVENMQQPNAHRVSLPIRQIIYGLLLNASPHLENMSWDALPSQPLAFSEMERINKNIKTSIVNAVELPKDHSDLSKLTELSLAKRQILLLDTLKVKRTVLESIPSSLKLPISVSCYWLQHTESKAKLHHLQALLLGMLMGPLHAIITSPDKEDLREDGARMLYEEFQRVKEQTRPGTRLDLDTAHIFCQWQCCLQMGMYLNQLLSTPLPEPDLTRLYSGSLVHGLCQQLLTSASVESLLSMCPKAKQLYEHLFNATRSYAPAELFLPKGKSNSKKRRQKKHSTSWSKNRVGTTSDTRCLYEGSNRFGLLMVENLEEQTEVSELE
ncbi:protein asteroid homolog 1 isoform X3 [Mirounga leonina]|uniref:protein asteroid homolog 1 isoform X3 n=1 Tax=Mirounga leonina TaxID=9715 RepID=UPI00156C0218|nr:protein asteroid homolog 1 isoform X3 [Mirounga leonina]XP_045759756.1 protein asteroid homolog 1 isoform X3 [Mirounga angustirostris]